MQAVRYMETWDTGHGAAVRCIDCCRVQDLELCDDGRFRCRGGCPQLGAVEEEEPLMNGTAAPAGTVSLRLMRRRGSSVPPRHLTFSELYDHAAPRRGLHPVVREWRSRNWPRVWAQAVRLYPLLALGRAAGLRTVYGRLSLVVIRADGEILDLGVASLRVVTNAGVAFIVDAFQNLVEPEVMKFHGIGTGTAAESASDTGLQSELTTQYSPDNTRATGSTTEAAANVYRTVGTNTVDAAVAITEHGIFSQASAPGGTLLDRSVFSAVNLASGDSLQTTYDLTFPAGG